MQQASFPGNLDSLDDIRRFVEAQASAAGVDRKATYRLCLAVDEIATNSIGYGYGSNGIQGEVVLTADTRGREFSIVLEDSAPAFDPRGIENKEAETLTQPLDHRRVGGLGVFLAVAGVDRFDYEYRDGKNRTTFAVNIKPTA